MTQYSADNITKDQLIALTMLYASHADYEFSMAEKQAIIDSVGEDVYQKVEEVYFQLSEYKCLEIIIGGAEKFFPTEEGLGELHTLIESQFSIDGKYCRLEKSQFEFLKRLLIPDTLK